MIQSRQELYEYIWQDAKANKRQNPRPKIYRDYVWKFLVTMRYLDFFTYKKRNVFYFIPRIWYKHRYNVLSMKLGFSIPYDKCAKGLALPHYGSIVMNGSATVGENCKILDCVNIGATNGSSKAPRIGNNVFIGSGARIIGDIDIADNVAIGANAVVVKSITEAGTTWGGVPARKISNNDSKRNLCTDLF